MDWKKNRRFDWMRNESIETSDKNKNRRNKKWLCADIHDVLTHEFTHSDKSSRTHIRLTFRYIQLTMALLIDAITLLFPLVSFTWVFKWNNVEIRAIYFANNSISVVHWIKIANYFFFSLKRHWQSSSQHKKWHTKVESNKKMRSSMSPRRKRPRWTCTLWT